MAIKITTEFSGIEVANAYARAEDFNGSKNGMDVQFAYYIDQVAAETGIQPFLREQYSFVPDVSDGALNYHKQFYSLIKGMPKFALAIDC